MASGPPAVRKLAVREDLEITAVMHANYPERLLYDSGKFTSSCKDWELKETSNLNKYNQQKLPHL